MVTCNLEFCHLCYQSEELNGILNIIRQKQSLTRVKLITRVIQSPSAPILDLIFTFDQCD